MRQELSVASQPERKRIRTRGHTSPTAIERPVAVVS